MNPKNTTAQIPQNLDDLLGYETDCDCGRQHTVALQKSSIRRGAVDDLVPFVRQIDPSAKILVVADFITRRVLGDTVEKRLQKAALKAQLLTLPDGAGGRPHADENTLKIVGTALQGFDMGIAVGAGTINDLVKLTSYQQGKPYLSVATAPSMNGYTSAIAAIMQRGVKQTVECHQPVAVIADLDILANAPHHLIASGLGDLESKPTSTADFRLGGCLKRSYYCSAPEQVVLAAEKKAADAASGLTQFDLESIEALTEALILSGISMKLAGSSSPASGGEHLISHYWDMTAQGEGRLEGWHGAQVGVATIVTATLYDFLARTDPGGLDFEGLVQSRPSADEVVRDIEARHGARGKEVAEAFLSKRLSKERFEAELNWISENWSGLWTELGGVLRPASRIREILNSAGAAVCVSDVKLTPAHLDTAYSVAREIRGRYTVLDLAADLGLLAEHRDEVLDASGCRR